MKKFEFLEKFKSLDLKILLLATVLVILTIPTFWRMVPFGIYTMHDFHVFRQFEFHKCIADFQIPCRWAQDAGFEYGEPLFNFYGQLSYVLAEPFHLAGLSVINSVKIAFIFSLVASALAMFLAAKQLWASNLPALISAILYVYAPYRAVDVWVRGALPEALSFVFFPLIFYFFNKFIDEEKIKDLLLLSLFTAALVILHNLSFLMFLPAFGVWVIYSLFKFKKWYLVKKLIGAGILTFLLSAFYLLPVVVEGKLVNLGKTVEGYYDFRMHFVNLHQLLISRIWGYGASVWGPEDNLSFSAGQIHWMISVLLIIFIFFTKTFKKNLNILVLVGLGWLALFLTHTRSTFFWELASPLQFLQFPWRFLSIAVFSFSLAAGAVLLFLKEKLAKVLVTMAIISVAIFTNFTNFREDIWRPISDEAQFVGGLWDEQVASAVGDFWPIYGRKIPNQKTEQKAVFLEGDGELLAFEKRSNKINVEVNANSPSQVQIAAVYFPGWVGFLNSQKIEIHPTGDLGLITFDVPQGRHEIILKFTNTKVRTAGNSLSLLGLALLGLILISAKQNVQKVN